MGRISIRSALALVALAVPAVGVSSAGAAAQTSSSTHAGVTTSWVVLADEGASAAALASRTGETGGAVTSVDDAVGLLTVSSADPSFATRVRDLPGVYGVVADRAIGATSDSPESRAVEQEARHSGGNPGAAGPKPGKGVPPGDPLDGLLWGMDMIGAPAAHKITKGDHRVTVGILDTGIDGTHPDLATNYSRVLSRNFVTDLPDLDGTCEFSGCVDPANWDDNGHGTHVAGTVAAAANGVGLSGVAPGITLVNLRGGQDSGYFFLAPVVQALTYAADAGIDVVNMSFYLDPWRYNCVGGAPEDSSQAATDQAVVVEAITRALSYAHDRDVTLVGSLGNNHEDLAAPRPDLSSPNPGDWPYPRTIDNARCRVLPVEGPDVLGVAAVGPSTTKADYSNYTTDVASGEIEVAAPGGWFRDGLGTPTYRTNENQILSTAPTRVLQDDGLVDAAGGLTAAGVSLGVQKACDEAGACGFYQYLQGTSMASPHAAGVAALAVSVHGHRDPDRKRGYTWAPDSVAALLATTATDHACPVGGFQSYTAVGRSPEFDATCVGTDAFNGFYGAGVVNALGVVR